MTWLAIVVIKSTAMEWTGHLALMLPIINEYQILFRTRRRKRPHGRPRRRGVANNLVELSNGEFL